MNNSVSEGSHLFVKWKEGLATTCSCPFQSAMPLYSSKMTRYYLNYVCVCAAGYCNPGPLPAAGQEGAVKLISSNKAMIPEMRLAYLHLSNPGYPGRSIKNVRLLARV